MSSTGSAQSHTVNLPDGSSHTYVLRGLSADGADLNIWSRFCAECFAYKANPPPASYFERHYRNDPRRDASLIRVLIDECNGEIVSSVRVFRRTVSCADGNTMEAGGIGEVCTSPDHRKRGLAKILLNDAIRIMEEEKMDCSLLHASPTLRPVYEKGGGYASVSSGWSVVRMMPLGLLSATDPKSVSVRAATFPSDTEFLRPLHQTYSEDRFAGCIVRSKEYWNEYISKELQGSLFVLTIDGSEKVVAWLSMRFRNECYQLREFGLDEKTSIGTGKAMSYLLRVALEDLGLSGVQETVPFHLPTPVLEELKAEKEGGLSPSFIDFEEDVTAENDCGWMYRTIRPSTAPSMTELTEKQGVPHLIWPSDSF